MPGLASKPIIDIVSVVNIGKLTIKPLEKESFIYKFEWNIHFKFGFTKRGDYKNNLYVFEKNHPEIELNILFQDHLRANPQSFHRYAKIKKELLSDKSSFQKTKRTFIYWI